MTRIEFIRARALSGYYDLPPVRDIIIERLLIACQNKGNGVI